MSTNYEEWMPSFLWGPGIPILDENISDNAQGTGEQKNNEEAVNNYIVVEDENEWEMNLI